MSGVVRVVRAGGAAVSERCAVADRLWARMKGLLGRSSLADGEGLLIRPAPSVHTFFMRFPIDVVFLDRNGCVLTVARAVPPWRARGCRRAYAVLELPAGRAEATGVRVGEPLTFPPVAGS